MSAPEVAETLQISRRQAGVLMRSGAIAARRLPSGAWITTAEAVERYRAHYRHGSGRQLNPATAWGVLWELSGRAASWLPRSTRSRVHRLIATASAEEIVRAVATRTQTHRFSSDRIASQVREGLTRTGVSAVHRLTPARSSILNVVMGYIAEDKIENHARRVEWTPDPAGKHVLFVQNLPVAYDGLWMPKAVIAADLIHSTDAGDRELAISAVDRLRTDYLRRRSRRTR